MRRRPNIIAVIPLFALAVAGTVAGAGAFEIPARVPVDLHGRVETVVELDESSTPFPWNHASRSPLAQSRLMTSVSTGTDFTGRLYVEGSARWNRVRALDDRAHLEFDQGDYLWQRVGDTRTVVRLFANERRYFTSSLSPTLLDDDRIDRHRAHGGARVDGSRGALGWTALGSILDDRSPRARRLGYASLVWYGAAVQTRVSYLSDHQGSSGTDTHAVVEGEVAGFYRRLTAVASYRQSGFDSRGFFLPPGDVDVDGYGGSNFVATIPSVAAAFGEARLHGMKLRTWGQVDVVARYFAAGADYVDDLASSPPGTITHSTGLFFRHNDVALDGRLVFERRTRFAHAAGAAAREERLLAHARAFLKNGSEVLLRGAVGFGEDDRAHRRNANFVHAAVTRSMKKLSAGVHAMAKDIDDGEFEQRFAMEARLNWSANVSLYGRVVTSDRFGSNDAAYWRVEMRPVDHVFVTFGYGRREIGDAPYVLEDTDIGPTGDIESVYAFTVRGDF